MKNTQNYKLNKPEETDIVSISKLNENMDILDVEVAKKVDKITGKGLSSEDFTASEKVKLSGIATSATNYKHPTTHPATMISEDSSHRFMTDSERNKLSGVTNGANNYVHPSNSVTRHVSDSEKSNWNSKATGSHTHSIYLPKTNVANNLTTTGAGYALDARQGKILNDAIARNTPKKLFTFNLPNSCAGSHIISPNFTIDSDKYIKVIFKISGTITSGSLSFYNTALTWSNSLAYIGSLNVRMIDKIIAVWIKTTYSDYTYTNSNQNEVVNFATSGNVLGLNAKYTGTNLKLDIYGVQ